jgi:2,3-bisphosphoglycerate-independent phosphoglycerate mutase
MHVLFFFWDGVGIGGSDPEINPFMSAKTPTLDKLLGGGKFQSKSINFQSEISALFGIDAQLGVKGVPQSATGQATLITGLNIPRMIGQHYGPKPNPQIVNILNQLSLSRNGIQSGTLFSQLLTAGKKVEFVNAYPKVYFNSIKSGKRNYSVFPLAAVDAGITLRGQEDLVEGRSLSADFTGKDWHEHLHITDTPLISAYDAGKSLAQITQKNDLTFFEYWETDYAGHKQDQKAAKLIIEKLDQVIEGLLAVLDTEKDLILITSDHGNLENLSTRRHSENKVPALLIGNNQYFRLFRESVQSIQDITPFILKIIQ